MRIITKENIERMTPKERRERIVDILTDGLLEWWKENRPPVKVNEDEAASPDKDEMIHYASR